jgi:hypothetical protein
VSPYPRVTSSTPTPQHHEAFPPLAASSCTSRCVSRPPWRQFGQRKPNRPAARHQGKAEEKYHGVRACEALFARRPGDIIRVYIAEDRRRHFAALLDHCAKARLGFQVVAQENLARISESTHHEGIVILARACPRWGCPTCCGRSRSGG